MAFSKSLKMTLTFVTAGQARGIVQSCPQGPGTLPPSSGSSVLVRASRYPWSLQYEVCLIFFASNTSVPTDFFLHGLFGLYMILFQFIVEFLERLEVLDSDTHLLDFLQQLSAKAFRRVRWMPTSPSIRFRSVS